MSIRWLPLCGGLLLVAGVAAAQIPLPADMPEEVRNLSAHHPRFVHYYVADFAARGLMTQAEAAATEAYMCFRYARRQEDLAAVRDLSSDERRAYMARKRAERPDPLTEYAEYSGLSPERARELMNLMHDTAKGDVYYERLQAKKQADHA
ncbi:MAG: somatostatin [Veillonellaceae bacterium]|nr:somatostatin [Veillonellaceae bacterium]